MQRTLIADVGVVAAHEQQLAPGYEYRPVQTSDSRGLAQLYFEAYPRSIVDDFAAAQAEIEQTFAGEFGQLLQELSPVAVANKSIATTVLTVEKAPWPDTPSGLFLIEVITHPEHRRRGLARTALVWVAKEAKKQGFESMALRVESENKGAVALYQTLGFREWVS